MFDPNAPLTPEAYRQLHDIADNVTLARIIAEHPKNQGSQPQGDTSPEGRPQ